MSDKAALAPLKRTNGSIQQIKHTLTPFLNLLDKYHNSEKTSQTFDKQQIVEAESAVALAMGTLRYMAHRLKGEERGKDKNDPLRMELDKMRRTLVQVKRLRKPEMKTSSEEKVGSASKRKSTQENGDGTNGDIANISSGGKKIKK
eukprot:scaffold197_cov268-Chaetoceros_neogracile.AAC.26